ncbi:MAG: hypothetical protein HC901_03635 [Bdellovibrionaceae bacterium]|nr:hypothetical protein [Pseudobdellovibrionaceae bacterium]
MEILTASLKEDSHNDQPEIIRALTRLHDPRAYPALRETTRHTNPQIAAMAVLSLGRQGDVDSVPLLRQLAQSKQPLVKSAAQVALNELAQPR